MHDYTVYDVGLSKQDIEKLELYRKKWDHPLLRWTGEYRNDQTRKEIRFVVTACGLARESDGKMYAALCYHEEKNWEMVGEQVVRAMCIKYPELSEHFFPEAEGMI